MKERFVVGSITGIRIGPAEGTSKPPRSALYQSRNGPTLWYVNDAAYCYRTVHECWREPEARKIAAELNAELT